MATVSHQEINSVSYKRPAARQFDILEVLNQTRSSIQFCMCKFTTFKVIATRKLLGRGSSHDLSSVFNRDPLTCGKMVTV